MHTLTLLVALGAPWPAQVELSQRRNRTNNIRRSDNINLQLSTRSPGRIGGECLAANTARHKASTAGFLNSNQVGVAVICSKRVERRHWLRRGNV